jgi:hypothetical protein
MGPWDAIALAVSVILWRSGGGPLGALIGLVLLELLGLLAVTVWRLVVKPATRKAKEEGLVGISEQLYQRVVVPLLYGSRGKR